MNRLPAEREFPKKFSSLPDIFQFLDDSLAELTRDRAVVHVFSLAVEEFFTNMVKYSPESSRDVRIRVSSEPDAAVVTLTDREVEPFDVTAARTPDTTLPLEERKPGGLGIFLSRELLDVVDYHYEDRCSTIILKKRLGA